MQVLSMHQFKSIAFIMKFGATLDEITDVKHHISKNEPYISLLYAAIFTTWSKLEREPDLIARKVTKLLQVMRESHSDLTLKSAIVNQSKVCIPLGL